MRNPGRRWRRLQKSRPTTHHQPFEKENFTMKKVISVIIAITMITCLFAGCAASSDSGVYKIAIVQQLDHASYPQRC